MLLLCSTTLFIVSLAPQQRVILQEGTATFSQPVINPGYPSSPDLVIDSDFGPQNGWAIHQPPDAAAEIACWEIETDLGPGALQFTLFFLHPNPGHLLGCFRISVTGDDRAEFADGLDDGGDVDANWKVLSDPESVVLPPGMSFSVLPDGSILTSGVVPVAGAYFLSFKYSNYPITGIRLETFEHSSLPFDGPGHFPGNGNFILTEMDVGYIPSSVLPQISVSNLISGQPAVIDVTNASPDSLVPVLYSLTGAGPAGFSAGPCGTVEFQLSLPINQDLPLHAADSQGNLSFSVNVPAGVTGAAVWFQAIDIQTCILSNVVSMTVG
ncbi:MAG: hypothetical protein DWQ01_21705 [Planctomycetota bacterium]|nr:MAG: hypothetical protein DWQ01_21705 [Planctomycetota bacterium]